MHHCCNFLPPSLPGFHLLLFFYSTSCSEFYACGIFHVHISLFSFLLSPFFPILAVHSSTFVFCSKTFYHFCLAPPSSHRDRSFNHPGSICAGTDTLLLPEEQELLLFPFSLNGNLSAFSSHTSFRLQLACKYNVS